MDEKSDYNPSLDVLKSRFCTLWERCSLAENDTDPAYIWENLIRCYSEPWRHYHNASHLSDCMQQLDLFASHLDDPDAAEMALWFHDAILDPGATDSEAKSAQLFEHSTGTDFSSDFVAKVTHMIRATEHRAPSLDNDTRILCDIDLSSLASPWDKFLNDSSALRAEQAASNDADYYSKKIGFLGALLKRPTIFLSSHFRDRYEAKAKENIQRYIAQLEAGEYT